MMITFVLRLKLAQERRIDAINTIRSMIGPTTALPGCRCCKLYCDVENDDQMILLEEWHSQEDLERHIRSDDFRYILAVMDLGSEPPDLAFHTVSSTAGMELIETLRD
jgi:quinol monooxygenase YgiN